MTRFNYSIPFVVISLVMIVVFQLSTYDGIAQDTQSTVSGRVINQDGEPIVGVTVMISMSRSKTDSEGKFTLTNISSRQVKLSLLDQNVGIQQIYAIKIGNVSVFYGGFGQDGAVPFTVTPGTHIKDVEVITENPLRIRSRIIFKNGEPLAGQSLNIGVDCLAVEISDSFSSNRSIQTDREGYFELSIYWPGVYTLSVNYRGLSAEIDPFLFQSEGKSATQVLKLNGNAEDFTEPPPEPKQNEHNLRENVYDIPGMWMINPLNGHAYKRISCKDRADAQDQAEKEDAYLVTITNLHEQVWLEAAFGAANYWIGITDVAEEGKWLWENGEQVTYTNWAKFESEDNLGLNQPPAILKFFGMKDERERHEDEIRDFAIMTFSDSEHKIGKWKKVHAHGAPRVGRVSMAIIEKEVK